MSDPIVSELARHRRTAWATAYRITGSADDADDVAQETCARALENRPEPGDGLRPWLLTVASRLAIDRLRRRQRFAYDGPWLPQPVALDGLDAPADTWPDARYGRLESASMAFLTALEALTANQRSVLVLRDVLDLSTAETASALQLSVANVKTTLHRARRALAPYDERGTDLATPDAHRAALSKLLAAVASGDVEAVVALLSDDVSATTDAGGEYLAARNTLVGARDVARFFVGIAGHPDAAAIEEMALIDLNGTRALYVQRTPNRAREAARVLLSLALASDGRIAAIFVHQADAKLRHVASGDLMSA